MQTRGRPRRKGEVRTKAEGRTGLAQDRRIWTDRGLGGQRQSDCQRSHSHRRPTPWDGTTEKRGMEVHDRRGGEETEWRGGSERGRKKTTGEEEKGQ